MAFLRLHGFLPDQLQGALDDAPRRDHWFELGGHLPPTSKENRHNGNTSMKNSLVVLIAALALSVSVQGCQAQASEKTVTTGATATAANKTAVVEDINGDTYLKMKAENPSIQLLDVRTPEEVAGGFIEGMKHINVHDALFAEKAGENLNKALPIVVYCKAGGRSARAAEMLTQNGFSQVYNLTGGISTWMTEGKATVK